MHTSGPICPICRISNWPEAAVTFADVSVPLSTDGYQYRIRMVSVFAMVPACLHDDFAQTYSQQQFATQAGQDVSFRRSSGASR
jgi:hypothetical protein